MPGARIVLSVQNLAVPKDPRVWREARTLAQAGYAVSVIAPKEHGQARHERLDGVEIHRYAPGPVGIRAIGQVVEVVVGLVQTSRVLARLRLGGPIDVLHVANPPDTSALLGLLLGPTHTRYVYDQHDLCPELLATRTARFGRASGLAADLSLAPLLGFLERLSYRVADLVVVPNNSYRRIACTRGGVMPDAVVTVRTGPDRVRAGGSTGWRGEGPLVVTFAGVMGRQDRVDVLLEAAADVLRRQPGAIRLEMVGDGDDRRRLEDLADRLDIDHAVTWRGWLTGRDFHRRLASADVAVSLDDDDPFSRLSTMIKVPEYLSHGLACVIADLPENRVSAGDAARYFEPGNPVDLAKHLEELAGDPALVAEMASAARRRAPGLLWSSSAPRLLEAYRWLLDGGPPVQSGDQPIPSD